MKNGRGKSTMLIVGMMLTLWLLITALHGISAWRPVISDGQPGLWMITLLGVTLGCISAKLERCSAAAALLDLSNIVTAFIVMKALMWKWIAPNVLVGAYICALQSAISAVISWLLLNRKNV